MECIETSKRNEFDMLSRSLFLVLILLTSTASADSYAMDFNGKTSISTKLIPGSFTSMTVEMEIKLKHNSSGTIFGNPENGGIGLGMKDGYMYASIHDGQGYAIAKTKLHAPTGVKMSIAAVYLQRKVLLFLNGKLQQVTTISGKRNLSRWPLMIGADPDFRGRPSHHITGRIYSVRISNRPRYLKDYAVGTLKKDGATIALYEFKSGVAGRAIDSSGKENHGSIVNPIWVKK